MFSSRDIVPTGVPSRQFRMVAMPVMPPGAMRFGVMNMG